jgi:WD40 repeat protein
MVHNALSADNLGRALKYLGECPVDLREWEWHYLMRLCRLEPLVLRNKTEVNSVAFSPNGDRLAAACGDGFVKYETRNQKDSPESSGCLPIV